MSTTQNTENPVHFEGMTAIHDTNGVSFFISIFENKCENGSARTVRVADLNSNTVKCSFCGKDVQVFDVREVAGK